MVLLAGEGGVSEGASIYNIPIVHSPGTNDIIPSLLSLVYNSLGGNGFLGQGWSIGGLSGRKELV
ncbi:MAG: SpvB/TcaC N-terminal domain-containing protein [Saprospiraceae bacterium]